MRVLVFGQRFKESDRECVQQLFQALQKEKIETYVFVPYLSIIADQIQLPTGIKNFEGTEQFNEVSIDIVITLGGDGTILKAVTLIHDKGVPIMGINLGRLGFLASIEKIYVEQAIDELIRGMYRIENRTMIYLETSGDIFGKLRYALNDFTLHKRDTSSMITIHTFINGDFLNSYWADGVILSTPTGSTGYSLSCGGPIIFPNSGNFVITPVAPHNLNVRPIVISDTSVVSFEIEGRSENFLATLDSRSQTVTSQHQIAVRKCDFPTRLVQLNNFSFLRTIHEKLTWGKDVRN
jgi:NAD+ kinase